MAIITKAALKALLETGDTLTQATFIDFVDSTYNGLPMSIGSYLGTASTFINDSNAGFYWSFNAATDDEVLGNVPLGASNVAYTGGDLKLIVKGRKNAAGTGTVGLIIRYAFIKDGDNSATEVTALTQQDITVDGETANVRFSTTMGNMTGEVGADTLLIGIERNSTGTGADTYAGNFEITDVWLDYV
jgi:hypothetical protein